MAEDIDKKNAEEKTDTIKIADDVIRCIAALAATDVENVAGMTGNATHELIARFGVRNLDKGVKVKVADDRVSIFLSVNLKYGCSIPAVSRKIQEKVKSAVESMTGFTVSDVNVKVSGIEI